MINKIINLSLRQFLVVSFGFFFVIWGTSWTFPLIEIPYSYIWISFSVFCLIFFNDYKIKINEILVLGLILTVASFYFILGMPDSLSSDKPIADSTYLIIYYLKIILGLVTFWALLNVFNEEEDLVLFIVSCSIFIILIISFLAWKYLIVYDLDYIGVIVDDSLGGNKTFKNSLATSLALLTPFLFAGLSKEKKFKSLFLVSFFVVLFFMYWVNSRSALIILGLQFILLLFLSKSKAVKRVVRISSVILVIVLTVTGFSLSQWISKSGSYSDSGYQLVVKEGLMQTHRGRMLISALDGAYKAAGLGNGLSTFRIRPENQGSRTETHNDYALLLYEQGIIGFGLITYLILWRIFLSIKLARQLDNRYIEASAASLVGLLLSMIFINIIQTSIFWTLIALNYCIFKIYKK